MKIAPGVRLNVNKRSVGMSVGTRGARYSVNSDGRRTRSVGIPGSGLYYRDQSGPTRRSGPAITPDLSPTRLLAHGVGIVTVAIFVFGVLEGAGSWIGTVAGIGIVAYVGLRIARPILDPLFVSLLTRSR